MTMKRTHSNGTPIHPTDGTRPDGLAYLDGMDEIAYFAAHAPEEIPYWFKVEPTTKPEEPMPAPEIADAAKEWDGTWEFAQSFDEHETPRETIFASKPKHWIGYREFAEKYEREYTEWDNACREIDLRDMERRYFQWRWYYGEQMAEHRGKK